MPRSCFSVAHNTWNRMSKLCMMHDLPTAAGTRWGLSSHLRLQRTQDLIIIFTDTPTPTTDLIQRQLYPVHTFTPYFPKIHFNILNPSYTWSLSWRVPSQNSVSEQHCLSTSSPLGSRVFK